MLEIVLIQLRLKMFSVGQWNLRSLHTKDLSALSMKKKPVRRSKFIQPSPQEKKKNLGDETMI